MPEVSESTDIAIIGMAGRFPGAATVDAFWSNLCNGTEAITHFTDEELLRAGVAPAVLHDPNYVKAGAILDDDIGLFDATFFGLTPQDARVMDPQQRLFLESVWNALENAGYYPENYPGTISLFGGSGMSTYLLNNIYPNTDVLEAVGPLQIALSNDKDSLTTRVAYLLNLTGPCYTVQTYCSTSLVAVCIACSSLRNYECDMALAGGVALSVPQKVGYSYQEGGIASPDARCRAFDARANGSPLGNGVGVVVLKRLEDALQDGDTIHAVIKGSAMNNDGSLKVGYTAPGVRGQTRVILEALANADVPAESISYIEAHGTGTPLGDAAELTALVKAFQALTKKKHFCAIGSVKTNIGHLDRAAGVTGLLKTVLALKHKLIPASLNYHEPNPQVNLHDSPFYVNTQLTEWASDCTPRRAGVSSFGIGGTNAHVIVEEAPTVTPTASSQSHQLLVLSARSKGALEVAIKNLKDYLQEHPELPLADVAYTLQIGRKAFEYRFAVVCRNHEEALDKLTTPAIDHLPSGTQPATEHTLALLRQEENISEAQLNTLGQLWVAGAQVDWTSFTAREDRRRVPLPAYPFERQRYWIDPPAPTEQPLSQSSQVSSEKKTDIADWFYRRSWRKLSPRLQHVSSSVLREQGPYMVFADKMAVGEPLVERLIELGQSVFAVQSGEQFSQLNRQTFSIHPQNPSDYRKLLQQLRRIGAFPKTIVYCWGINASGSSELDLEPFQVYFQESISSLLHLVRALGQEASSDDVQLLLVSDQGHKVTGQEEYHPYQALFLSIATVIGQEYLTLACHCVDLDLRDPQREAQSVQQLLITLAAPLEPLIAYRNTECWVSRFDPVHLGPLVSSPLRMHGVYLITGGLGHIGLALAEHLAKQFQAKLILVSRSILPPRLEWDNWLQTHSESDLTSQKIIRLQQIERAGAEILLLQADVADEQAMTAVLHQVDERFGTLHGVIHAAGITSAQAFHSIEETRTQQWQGHFHSKVHGVLTLEKVLRGRTLDFCVLFSSLSTVLGGLGFVAYAAANAFMDAISSHYNNASTFPWISIDWDTWQFVQEKQQGIVLGKTVSMYTMTPDEGIEALQRILDAKAEVQQVVVSTGELQARINQWVKMETMHEHRRDSALHLPAPSSARSTRPALANAYVAPDNEVQQAIARLWEECLGIEGIGIYDNFFALGGHSLVGTQLISRIRRQFDIHLPMAALFESPTIAELALMVELALIEEIEQLDDVRL